MIVSSSVEVKEQKDLISNTNKTAPLLLTTTYVEAENVIDGKQISKESENLTNETQVLTAASDTSISSKMTESNVVVTSLPLKDKKKKALKPNTNKVEPKEIAANKEVSKESEIEKDILPDFISIKEDAKEGENIQLGFAI